MRDRRGPWLPTLPWLKASGLRNDEISVVHRTQRHVLIYIASNCETSLSDGMMTSERSLKIFRPKTNKPTTCPYSIPIPWLLRLLFPLGFSVLSNPTTQRCTSGPHFRANQFSCRNYSPPQTDQGSSDPRFSSRGRLLYRSRYCYRAIKTTGNEDGRGWSFLGNQRLQNCTSILYQRTHLTLVPMSL